MHIDNLSQIFRNDLRIANTNLSNSSPLLCNVLCMIARFLFLKTYVHLIYYFDRVQIGLATVSLLYMHYKTTIIDVSDGFLLDI